MAKVNMTRKDWDDFRETGLLWFMNRTLHLFGWVIVLDYDDDGKVVAGYPARTLYRGFGSDVEESGYKKVTKYLADTIKELQKEVEDG